MSISQSQTKMKLISSRCALKKKKKKKERKKERKKEEQCYGKFSHGV
jgi:hypothetical protein